MKFSAFTAVLAAAAVAVVSVSSVNASDSEDWTYKQNVDGLASPAQWGTKHATCGGKRQSPIDIAAKTASKGEKAPLAFSGSCTQFNVTQKYDAFKAEVDGGSCAVTVNDKAFSFAQVHFHTPSEHTLNGKPLAGEAHFVHQAADGSIVVVGLFLEVAACGETDSFASQFISAFKQATETAPKAVKLDSFHSALEAGIAGGRTFNYPGSLTTPSCDEIVDWWVIEKPLAISKDEFSTIKKQFKRIAAANDGNNARPTQPLNGRTVTAF